MELFLNYYSFGLKHIFTISSGNNSLLYKQMIVKFFINNIMILHFQNKYFYFNAIRLYISNYLLTYKYPNNNVLLLMN